MNDALLCKVADFGLSRELENADSSRGEYCTSVRYCLYGQKRDFECSLKITCRSELFNDAKDARMRRTSLLYTYFIYQEVMGVSLKFLKEKVQGSDRILRAVVLRVFLSRTFPLILARK